MQAMITQAVRRETGFRPTPHWAPESSLRDCFCQILDRIASLHRYASGPLHTLGVTSCHGGEGVSTVAMQLALAASSWRYDSLLLVDANLSQPVTSRSFDARSAAGLAEAVAGEPAAELIQETLLANLSFLPAGRFRGSPAQTYQSPGFAELTRWIAERFDLAIFDLPPAAATSCLSQVVKTLDGIVLVIEADRVHRRVAQRFKELTVLGGGQIVGVVLNKCRDPIAEHALGGVPGSSL
jgi:capsular exopolysaccharide synthesis family protein